MNDLQWIKSINSFQGELFDIILLELTPQSRRSQVLQTVGRPGLVEQRRMKRLAVWPCPRSQAFVRLLLHLGFVWILDDKPKPLGVFGFELKSRVHLETCTFEDWHFTQ